MLASPVTHYLAPGERLLWSGRPAQGLLFTAKDLLLVPFSLMWGGFAIFWETMVWFVDAPWFFKLWGVPFVCVGLYLIFGRFLFDAWLRKRTWYAVTDRRVLILRTGPYERLTALDIRGLSDVRLHGGRSRRGTIQFGAGTVFPFARGFAWSPAVSRVPQFLAIDEAQSVFDRITGQRGG